MPHRDSLDALHAHKASLELRVSELEAQLEAANTKIRELELTLASMPRRARFAPAPAATAARRTAPAREVQDDHVAVRPILVDSPTDTAAALIASITSAASQPTPTPKRKRKPGER